MIDNEKRCPLCSGMGEILAGDNEIRCPICKGKGYLTKSEQAPATGS